MNLEAKVFLVHGRNGEQMLTLRLVCPELSLWERLQMAWYCLQGTTPLASNIQLTDCGQKVLHAAFRKFEEQQVKTNSSCS